MSKEQAPAIYSFLEMEAALCVWEWMIEQKLKPLFIADYPALAEAWEKHGTAEMRLCLAVKLGRYAIDLHDALDGWVEDAGQSYDWDFIPWVCNLMTRAYMSHITYTVTPVMPSVSKAVEMYKADFPQEDYH